MKGGRRWGQGSQKKSIEGLKEVEIQIGNLIGSHTVKYEVLCLLEGLSLFRPEFATQGGQRPLLLSLLCAIICQLE